MTEAGAGREEILGATDSADRTSGVPPRAGTVDGSRAAQLLERVTPGVTLETREEHGELILQVDRSRLVEVCTLLSHDDGARYRLPVMVTAVDWLEREPRFDVVYELYSVDYNDRVRLVVQVPEHDPVVPTLEKVFPGMDWHERETFDLFGISFAGHHDLRRLLLPEDWEGHPLRKDYVSFGEPVAFTHNLEWALAPQDRPEQMPGSTR